MARITRRTFLSTVGQSACAVAFVSPIAGITAAAAQKSMDPIILDLTKPENEALTKTGGAIKIPNPLNKKRPIIVIRNTEAEISAYSSKCTHMGCEIGMPVEGVMTCPCHKAQFDMSGNAVRGPAKKPLMQFTAVLEETSVTISAPAGKK